MIFEAALRIIVQFLLGGTSKSSGSAHRHRPLFTAVLPYKVRANESDKCLPWNSRVDPAVCETEKQISVAVDTELDSNNFLISNVGSGFRSARSQAAPRSCRRGRRAASGCRAGVVPTDAIPKPNRNKAALAGLV
jgi:hypothetical protein